MQNFISLFLYSIKHIGCCKHENALLNSDEGYCPNCGVYLKKYYYIVRCKCCDVKREATKMYFGYFGDIVPVNRFCTNCGGEEFYVEKLEKLGFVDVHYAIEVKEPIKDENIKLATTQIWVEEPDKDTGLKFLPKSA